MLAHRYMLFAVFLGSTFFVAAPHDRSAHADSANAAAKPNVLLIYTDDQGYGDVACLNPDSKIPTASFDRLAREGMVFTDAHSSDTVCTPSRYGLLTGRYSWRTTLKKGVYGAEKKCLIEDGRVTLASLLRDQGYATAMVGKWHLGMQFPGNRASRDWSEPVRDMPLDKGFDYFFGIPASMNYGVLAWFEGRHAAVPPTLYTSKKPNRIALSDYRIRPPYREQVDDLGKTNDLGVVKGPLEVAPDFKDSECLTRFTDQAIAWIDEHAAAARSEEQPFFLYLPYTSPHKPVVPLEQFRGQSGAGAYGDFVIETDWHIGRLLDLLDREGLADNTLVIVTSDNGPETTWKQREDLYQHASNGYYRGGKRSIYEGGHRVPFVVRWPERVDSGSRSHRPICQTDLLATLAEMLTVKLPDDAAEDSVSFYRTLMARDEAVPRPPMIHHSARGGFAIRDGRWKLILEGPDQERELYDLTTDPEETVNVLEAHPLEEERLVNAISSIVRSGRTTEGPRQPNDTDWWPALKWMSSEDFTQSR